MSIGQFGFRVLTLACLSLGSVLVGVVGVAHRADAQAPAPSVIDPAQPAQSAQPTAAPAAPAAPPAVAPEVAIERAREAYAQGQKAFAQGDFAVAQAAFEEAFANVPNPVVLVSIAESAAKLWRVEAALAAYDKYLGLRPDAPDRVEVEQKRAVLAQTPGEVTITSEPPSADVMVDDQASGKRTPAVLSLPPGVHRVKLVLAGYESEQVELQIAPGARSEQGIALRTGVTSPQAAEAAAPETAAPAALGTPARPPVAAIAVTTSLGAAGLIVGTALGILALSERSDYDRMPTKASADRGERLALFSDVGFGIGAMALVTTAVLLLTHDAPASDSDKKPTARLELIPNVSPSGASATAKLRF